MTDFTIKIPLKCFFCHSSDLSVLKDENGNETDQVLCLNCQKMNSMLLLKQAAKRQGLAEAKTVATKQIQEAIAKIFKKK